MEDINEIINLIANPSEEDLKLITKAFDFSKIAHNEQFRLSGEPYFSHVFETAKILASLGMGPITISAGLLHDTLEDTETQAQEIEDGFGSEILFLIEGVTKLGKLKYQGKNRHNESLRKLFVAISQDIRVLMIKMADRLHNMRTLENIREDKKKRIALETLEIYAPIAYRLGIRKLNRELEDLSFPYAYPNEYEEMKKTMKLKREENLENLEKFLRSVKKALAKEKLTDVKTEYRVKGLYSLYKKLKNKKISIEEIHDILALRVLVPTINDCYQALGIIHNSWRPVPSKVKDYIASPKQNGYRSLHTTVFTGDGNIVEIQIKTEGMHLESEFGIASHISYKEGPTSWGENYSWVKTLLPKKTTSEKTFENKDNLTDIPFWIRELVEYQKSNPDDKEFVENIRKDFLGQNIFVFTPQGDVLDLPVGSCPLDFAYTIHSAIGNHTFAVKVNSKMVSLDKRLENGDIVEILTRPSSRPTQKWLAYVKTTTAKKHIRSFLQSNKS